MSQTTLNSKRKVLLLGRMYHEAGETLLAEHTKVTLLEQPTQATLCQNIHDAAGIVVRYPNQLDRDAIRAAEELLVISTSGRGTDAVDIEVATEMGIVVVNNPNLSTTAVVEHTMALILALAKNLHHLDNAVRRGNYAVRNQSIQLQLSDKTIGIVGLGHIGKKVAHLCQSAFGMQVLAYDPYVEPAKAERCGASLVAELDELLARSDFVSMHPELNEGTESMIGRDELQMMKPTAFLINVARGKVVNEAALVQALTQEWIAGAALDVFETEPPPTESPLHKLKNVILSPHVAGVTPEACRAMSLSAASQILQLFRGEKPQHIVNPEVWKSFRKRES